MATALDLSGFAWRHSGLGIWTRDAGWKHRIRQKPTNRAEHAAQGRAVGFAQRQFTAEDHSSDHRRNGRASD